MKLTDFSIEPAVCVPGETVQMSFTVTAERGDEVNGLTVWITMEGIGEVSCHSDSSFTLAAGKSRSLQLPVCMPEASGLLEQLAESRTFTVHSFGVQFGLFGTRTNAAFDFTFLDARYSPSVVLFSLERATDGAADDEGEALLADLTLGASAAAKTENMQLRIYYARGAVPGDDADFIDLSGRADALLEGVSDCADLITQQFDKSSDWYFRLWFGDEYESASASALVARAFANMHLSGADTGGVCFGGFSTAEPGAPKLESYYPLHAYGGIEGVTNYCEAEVPTGGCWIDGKPVYRRIFSFGAVATGARLTVGTLENPGTVLSAWGMAFTGTTYMQIPATNITISYVVCCYVKEGNVIVECGSSRSLQSGWIELTYTHAD